LFLLTGKVIKYFQQKITNALEGDTGLNTGGMGLFLSECGALRKNT
jgi:phosphoribosylamine-glycine ligase